MTEQSIRGPVIYRNWNAWKENHPLLMAWEYPVYTDAKFTQTDEFITKLGPYTFFFVNQMSGNRYPNQPVFVLRVHHHLNEEPDYPNETSTAEYTGGLAAEDIVALISLCLGIRIKAGGANRVISATGYDNGLPVMLDNLPHPVLLPVSSRPILPNALSVRSLDFSKPLDSLANKSVQAVTALVRAARMYQEALWIVEATPEISWLLLTSAIETIALEWSYDDPPIEKMRNAGYKDLETNLIKMGATDEMVGTIANRLSKLWGAGAKFRNFIINNLPSAPSVRPPLFAQHVWTPEAIKETVKWIYDHRSKALHAGIPFPAPLCISPEVVGENGEYAEIPTGTSVSMRGGTWSAENTAWMYLNTYEYIVRNSILKWWMSI